MPILIPNYVYTLFASVIVGTLIITTCAMSTVVLKEDAETQALANVADYIAAKSMELAANPPASVYSSTLHLEVPALIGNQIYWIKLQNDSSKAWVEVGFGRTPLFSNSKVYIPVDINASGTCISSSETVKLQFCSGLAGANLTLSGGAGA